MMKSFWFVCLVAVFRLTLLSQVYPHQAQTIKGENVELLDTAKALVVCYSSGHCSACFRLLVHYCSSIVEKHPHVQLMVLITGNDVVVPNMMGLRMATSSMQEYFEGDVPKIVYDSNPDKGKRYCTKFKMKHFPVLLLFDRHVKTPKYIPYEKLFSSDSMFPDRLIIPLKTRNQIIDFIRP
jgi:hypothetical protein